MTIISQGAKGLKVLPSFTCMERVKFITNILQVQKGLNLSSLFKAGNLTIISLGAKGLKVLPSLQVLGAKGLKVIPKFYKYGKG